MRQSKQEWSNLLLCPLTKTLMEDPVIDEFGISYEKKAIQEWMRKYETSPNGPIYTRMTLIENLALKRIIEAYKKNPNSPTQDILAIIESQQLEISKLRQEITLLKKLQTDPSTTKMSTFDWIPKKSLDDQARLQDELVSACLEGNLLKALRHVSQGANPKMPNLTQQTPLSAAIWGLNFKLVKKLVKMTSSDPQHIEECLALNKKIYGSPMPILEDHAALTLNHLGSDYLQTSGRNAIFLRWVIDELNLGPSSCIQLTSGKEITLTSEGLGSLKANPSDTKLSVLAKPDGRQAVTLNETLFQALLTQYMFCEKELRCIQEYLNGFGAFFTVIALTPLTPNFLQESALSSQAAIIRLLEYVTGGKQDEAESMIRHSPHLLKLKADIIDRSGRKFLEIHPLQYAVWALDWYMYDMIISYMDEADIRHQLATQKQITEASGHGEYYQFDEIIQALNLYVKHYDSTKLTSGNSKDLLEMIWRVSVSHAQKMFVAHVVNQYCHPDRHFRPAPEFNEEQLPRVFQKKNWNGDWWKAKYDGVHIGEDTIGDRGWAVHRGWAAGGPGPWEGGPPTGMVTKPTAETDLAAMVKLSQVALRKVERLKRKYLLSQSDEAELSTPKKGM